VGGGSSCGESRPARLLQEQDPTRTRVALETIEDVARETVGETKVAGYEDARAKLVCWTPNDGWWVSIEWNGKRPRTGVSDTFPQVVHGVTKLKGYKPAARVLEFGRHWRLRCDNPGNYATCKRSGVTAFTCASLRTGLTCRNAVGHGFWIGRFRGYRLF
jgi:hypothetical protein